MQEQAYINEVAFVLYNFQLIEETLRSYIQSAIKIIKKKTSGIMPFKYDRKWTDKDSMSTLIKKFEKINDNHDLVKKLKFILPDRNKVAHKGLLISVPEWDDKLLIAFKIAELKKLRSETRSILVKVMEEYKKIKDKEVS